MKGKRWVSALLCLLLCLMLAVPPAGAVEKVYFVAAGENILPLSDETMPFWNGGYLYIASSIFTGMARNSLDVGQIPAKNNVKNQLILYSGSRQLSFPLDKNSCQSNDGQVYTPGALQRGGTVFVPTSVVAKFFGLQYSVIEVEHGYLVWLRQPGYSLTDKLFANAATYPMAERYAAYIKAKETAAEPAVPPAETPQGVEIDGRVVCLCLKAGDDTAALLDVLDRYGAQAAFFCTPDFLEKEGGLLRRMTATGNSIAILIDGEADISVEEQLSAGNRALERATCGVTRLAMVQNGKGEAVRAVREAGYRCLTPDLDRSAYELRSASNAMSLLKRLAASRASVTVWLADTADAVGLRAFLSEMEKADGRCLALTETSGGR